MSSEKKKEEAKPATFWRYGYLSSQGWVCVPIAMETNDNWGQEAQRYF